ncbi:hypothetical protein [Sulfurimonas sp. NWX367]|uniref:hypothetical protein n=3 Tax=Sulfurimonadaceae TaxID=2771471 RepID=UPI003204D532
MMNMTLEQKWIENDYNPFILFRSNGKIISLNTEAQFLLGSVQPSELFNLAQTYANITFGFKTTFLELEYGRYKFFAITVGYEDEECIGIKLYQAPTYKINTKKPDGELTNIFTITDLCIASNSISSEINFIKNYDPTIPDVVVNANNLIKLLNFIYKASQKSRVIETKISYIVGEYIKFHDKKYGLFSISVIADNIDSEMLPDIKMLADKYDFYVEITKKSISIHLPIITH